MSNERSQHKNKEKLATKCSIRLYEHELQKRKEKSKELNSKTDIGWGHQIRSYVLQPYQLVKDLQTKVKVQILRILKDRILTNL